MLFACRGQGDPCVHPDLHILHDDPDLLVLNKPANLVCHPTKAGPLSSLIGRVRLHLGDGATAHLVNRLDRETSGIVVVARTDRAARELRRLWERRRVDKGYLAVVRGHVGEDRGVIEEPIGRDEASRVAVKNRVRADGAVSRTDFEVIRRFAAATPAGPLPCSLLRVLPHTGRKHQIRVHLAHLGHPVLGDKLYGGCEDDYLALVEDRLTDEARARLVLASHALHARSVRFAWGDRELEFSCEPEGDPWRWATA